MTIDGLVMFFLCDDGGVGADFAGTEERCANRALMCHHMAHRFTAMDLATAACSAATARTQSAQKRQRQRRQ